MAKIGKLRNNRVCVLIKHTDLNDQEAAGRFEVVPSGECKKEAERKPDRITFFSFKLYITLVKIIFYESL